MTFNPTKTKNVFFFLPNLIGYSRVVFCAIALYYLPYKTSVAFIFYAISCLLDAFDGQAARKFNQTSSFGAVLDMVTDRSTTSCLLVYLTLLYPDYTLFWQFLIALDLSSHYMQMYSSLYLRASSHKSVDPKKSAWILRQYYTNNKVLFGVCAGNELFYIGLYLLGNFYVLNPSRFSNSTITNAINTKTIAPVTLFAKSLEQVGFSVSKFREIALTAAPSSIIDAAIKNTKWNIICALFKAITTPATIVKFYEKNYDQIVLVSIIILILITSPIFLFKQIINVIQMAGASRNLAKHDAELKFGKSSSTSTTKPHTKSSSTSTTKTPTKSSTARGRSKSVVREEIVKNIESDDESNDEEEFIKLISRNTTSRTATPRKPNRQRSVSRTPAKNRKK